MSRLIVDGEEPTDADRPAGFRRSACVLALCAHACTIAQMTQRLLPERKTPIETRYTNIRLPRALADALKLDASKEGVSLNRRAAEVLAAFVEARGRSRCGNCNRVVRWKI